MEAFLGGTSVPTFESADQHFGNLAIRFFYSFSEKLNIVFALKKSASTPGEAYAAADGGPFVGTIDLTTGIITPVVTGLGSPGGMVFVNTSKFDQDDSQREDRDSCHDRDGDSH